MTFWVVLVCVLLAIWLIGHIRLGAVVAYSESGFALSVKAGPKRVQILPAKKKVGKKKPEKEKNTKEKTKGKPEKPKRAVKDTVSAVMQFLPLVGEAAGRFKRKIRIDYVRLHIIWGSSDPAVAAKGYGAGNAVMGILWPVIEHNFNVKEHDLRVAVDFERSKPEIIAGAQVTITIAQCFSLSLRLGFKALKIFLGIRRGQTDKTVNEKAVQA